MNNNVEIPLNHYLHLERLALLRRCTISEAMEFLFKFVAPNKNNWIDEHFGKVDQTKFIPTSYSQHGVMERIQGLPRNIRPITDGPYLSEMHFFAEEPGLIGIEANGIKMLDFEMATQRDITVFELVKDLLPPMTIQQYRVYNTFCSQYLRLVREPHLFTMPSCHAPAIDVGCYVGYKAFALAEFVGKNDVLAFEMESDNYAVLEKNVALNPRFKIKPFKRALSDHTSIMAINTRNKRTMAHSLTSFQSLKERNTSLLSDGKENNIESVHTDLLDDLTSEYQKFSAVHISVNGHEPEVSLGSLKTLQRTDIIRISCPYIREGIAVFDIVSNLLRKNGIKVFGKSGAAVVAGKVLGNYHVEKKPTFLTNVRAIVRQSLAKLHI